MVLLVDQIRVVVKVATGAKDGATAEVLVAENARGGNKGQSSGQGYGCTRDWATVGR